MELVGDKITSFNFRNLELVEREVGTENNSQSAMPGELNNQTIQYYTILDN